MAVPTFTIYNGTSASTSHTIPLPAGRAGARVFIFLAPASGPSFNGNGSTWNVVTAGGLLGGLYWRDCTGSEANPSVTFGGAQQFRAATAMLAAGSFFGAPVVNAVPPNTIDPPAVATNSGNGTVIAFTGWTHTTTCNLSSNPSGYTAGTSGNGTASIPGLAVAYKSVAPAAASENPGTFTLSASPTVFSSNTIFQASTLIPTLHTNTQTFGGDDGVSNFTPPALDASCFTFGQSPSANTSHNIPLPTDLNGKRLIVAFTGLGTAASAIVFPAGWTLLDTVSNANQRQEILYRDCDGTEGASITVTTATSILAGWATVAFAPGTWDRNQVPVSSASTSTSTLTPNPPSLNSGAGLAFSRGSWWLSCLGQRGVASPPTVTAAPAGFTLRGLGGLGVNVYGSAWADKTDNVQTLDPGTWTSTGTATNQSAATIAVKAQKSIATIVATPPPTTITLTPTLFTNAQSFGSPTLLFARTLTPALYTNPQSYGSVRLQLRIFPTLYADPDTFGSPTIKAGKILLPTLFVDPDTFGAPTIKAVRTVFPTLFVDPDTFGASRIGKVLKPTLFLDPDTFGAPIIRLAQTIRPTHYSDPDTFGSPKLRLTLHPVLFADPDTFGIPGIATAGALKPLRYVNPQTFGSPTLRAARTITPTKYTNPQSFGSPTITSEVLITVQPTHFLDPDSFGSPTIIVSGTPPTPPSGAGYPWYYDETGQRRKRKKKLIFPTIEPEVVESRSQKKRAKKLKEAEVKALREGGLPDATVMPPPPATITKELLDRWFEAEEAKKGAALAEERKVLEGKAAGIAAMVQEMERAELQRKTDEDEQVIAPFLMLYYSLWD